MAGGSYGVCLCSCAVRVDLWTASPMRAVRHTATPVLLIHGTRDVNIPAVQSEHSHAANSGSTELWLALGGHVEASGFAGLKSRADVGVRRT